MFEYTLARLCAERTSSDIACKICGQPTQLFDVVDFRKCCSHTLYPEGLAGVPVFYRSCNSCRFIFTTLFDGFTTEQWRTHIYNDKYHEFDPEYLEARPRQNAFEIGLLLAGKKKTTVALDYGGGNGFTAVLLRQRGWNCDTYDPYDLSDLQPDQIGEYNFCSAFEVFEHSPDPVLTMSEIVRMTSPHRLIVYVGTGVHDLEMAPDKRLLWSYAAPRNGHVSLYSRRALQLLGQRFQLNYISVSRGTHLLFRGVPEAEARLALLRTKFASYLRRAIMKS